jgi:DNA-binding CsgD family transcriptional regulator
VLRLSAEQCVVVQPLADSDALDLFTARARAANPRFDPTSDNGKTVAQICRRLDHLPLAIELAAARVAVLPLPALLARLERSLGILTDGHRDRPDRLRTMRGAIAWSYNLLPPDVQVLFRQLAVFDGGFQLDAVSAVASGKQEADIFDGIALLSAHSLLTQSGSQYATEPRFGMLETVRDFALEQLEAHGERREAERRHASWFADWFQAALPEMRGPRQAYLLGRGREEQGNRSAAIRWSLEHDSNIAMRLLKSPQDQWRNLQEVESILDSIRHLLASWRGSGPDRAAMLVDAARSFFSAGRFAEGLAYASEAETIFRDLGDERGVARALVAIGHTLISLAKRSALIIAAEHLAAAATAFGKGVVIGQELGEGRIVAAAFRGIGDVALHRGEYQEAVDRLRRALDFLDEPGPHDAVAWTFRDLGVAQCLNGDMKQAAVMLSRSLAMQRDLDNRGWGYGQTQKTVSLFLLRCSYVYEAIRLYESSDAVLSAFPSDIDVTYQFDEQPMEVAMRSWGARNEAQDAAESPYIVSMMDAVERAFALLAEVADGSGPPNVRISSSLEAHGLTPREREVLALLAQGLSDREIASRLSLSPYTIHGHVSHVLGKLGVESRTAAVAFAVRNGMS